MQEKKMSYPMQAKRAVIQVGRMFDLLPMTEALVSGKVSVPGSDPAEFQFLSVMELTSRIQFLVPGVVKES
ncbi:hypothetical protein V6N12_052736 [Hibiscus sabdariffa]|uniref:Uncharacterized protein n=1 Tax=Hibiscus sabdariffa TaxID=183260 RepID=A0ABR2C2G9_9ROSI